MDGTDEQNEVQHDTVMARIKAIAHKAQSAKLVGTRKERQEAQRQEDKALQIAITANRAAQTTSKKRSATFKLTGLTDRLIAAIPSTTTGINVTVLVEMFKEDIPKSMAGCKAFYELIRGVAKALPGGFVRLRPEYMAEETATVPEDVAK